jgi:hypothetical protein
MPRTRSATRFLLTLFGVTSRIYGHTGCMRTSMADRNATMCFCMAKYSCAGFTCPALCFLPPQREQALLVSRVDRSPKCKTSFHLTGLRVSQLSWWHLGNLRVRHGPFLPCAVCALSFQYNCFSVIARFECFSITFWNL